MKKLKYGKIKCTTPSNIFGTVIQLIIRMKKLVEGQYDFFIKYPNSTLVATIIDAYEQFVNKKEYINIDSFIHLIRKDVDFYGPIQFKDLFSTILWQIDFSNISEIQSYKQICYTILDDLINKKENESYIFDISLENDKGLSSIIQNQYNFATAVIYKPDFLFFSPVQSNNINYSKMKIDEKISFKHAIYYLSIIVVKKIKNDHFVLFVGLDEWYQIDNEDIIIIETNELFSKIINQEEYKIELFGFSKEPKNNIISCNYNDEPKDFPVIDLDKLDYEQPKSKTVSNISKNYTSTNVTYNNGAKDLKYTVTYKEFNYTSCKYSNIKIERFASSVERDNCLREIKKDADLKCNLIYYETKGDIGTTNCFDQNETEITVYSVPRAEQKSFESLYISKTIEIEFREKDGDDIINEELPAYKASFRLNHPTSDIFKYCYQNIPGKPKNLYKLLKYKNIDKYYFREITDSKTQKIEDIVEEKSPNVIYYLRSVPLPKCEVSKAPLTSSAGRRSASISKENSAAKTSRNDLAQNKSQKSDSFSKSQYVKKNTSNSESVTKKVSPTKPVQQVVEPKQQQQQQQQQQPETNDKLIISRCYRSYLFNNDGGVKRFVFTNKSLIRRTSNYTVNDLLKYVIKAKNPKLIVYVIDPKNYFKIQNFELEAPIENLPAYFNVQVRPHKSHPYITCVAVDIKNINPLTFDPNKDCCPFAVKYEKGQDIKYIKEKIIEFLFHSCENKEEIIYNKNFYPDIYTFNNTSFIEIIKIKEIEIESKPIFVTWKSEPEMKFVLDLINKHTAEEIIS